MKYWLAFDIGCIECGEGSGPLGLFKTKEEALQVADKAREAQAADWSGEHHFEVYEVKTP
jgi:hypothetical protein